MYVVRVLALLYSVVMKGRRESMKNLHLLVTALEKVSDDRIIEAASYAIKAGTIGECVAGILFVIGLFYLLCKVVNAFSKK